MEQLLTVLGRRSSRGAALTLVSLFVALVLAWLVCTAAISHFTGIGLLPLQAVGWALWFYWQGRLFPQHRRSYLSHDPETAYRMAFIRDVVPGVTFGVAQMARPIFHGSLEVLVTMDAPSHSPWVVAVGALVLADGVLLLVLGFATIGPDSAGFLYEYLDREKPLLSESIYSCIRHPLFLGGAFVSIGGALMLGGRDISMLGLLNLAIVPVYGRIEDKRLTESFGSEYRDYTRAVNRFFPRPASVRSAVPHLVRQARDMARLPSALRHPTA